MYIQINPIQFACFIAAFNSIDGFEGMPWAERVEALHERYGFYVCERTLSNWCSKLYDLGIITRAGTSSAWMTTISNGLKTRRRLQPEEQEEIEAYFRRRGELQQEFYKESTLPPIEARKTSYRSAYSILWQEYGCEKQLKGCYEVNSAAHLKGLTFKRMEAYIDSHDDENHSIRKHYDKLRGNSAEARAINASSYSYIKMRDWFLKQFPEILEFLNNREELINAKSDTTAAA